uniref:RdRp n=1 Tax=Rhododendron betaflexivirus 1 TaxID=2794406 RepID=A0A7T5QZB1_9VIRU|nr:RdRp [Rhododendron betaflexivirus 1]
MSTFNYRSPLESSLEKISSDKRDHFCKFQLKLMEINEEKFGDFFNFKVDDVSKEFLCTSGVYQSPFAHLSHSHPISKMIENHFLYVVAGARLSEMPSPTIISTKSFKAERLMKLVGNESFYLWNRLIDSGDVARYGPSALREFVTPHTKEGVNLLDEMAQGPISDESFSASGVNLFGKPDKNLLLKNVFIHDEIHHWSLDQMLTFLDANDVENLMATLIYPVELLEGHKYSCNPGLYSFKVVDGSTICFAPDGCYSESYQQQADLSWLFKASHLVTRKRVVYTVVFSKTIGAHHFVEIIRKDLRVPTRRYFDSFDVLDMSSFSAFDYRYPVEGVRLSVFKKVAIYLMSLKKADSTSAIAKFRQLVSSDFNMCELFFIKDFADLFVGNGVEKLSQDGLCARLWNSMYDFLPVFAQKMFCKTFNSRQLLKCLYNLSPMSIDVKLERVDCKFHNPKDLFGFLHKVPTYEKQSNAPIAQWRVDKKVLWARTWVEEGFDEPTYRSHTYAELNKIDLFENYPEVSIKYYHFDRVKSQYVLRATEENVNRFEMWCEIEREPEVTGLAIMWYDDFHAAQSMDADLKEVPITEMEDPDWGENKSSSDSSAPSNESVAASHEQRSPRGRDVEGKKERKFLDSISGFVKVGPFKTRSVEEFVSKIDWRYSMHLRGRNVLFFSKGNFSYGHNNLVYPSSGWPKVFDAFCRDRFNSVLVQQYDRDAKIGFHADDESVYDEDVEVLTVNLFGGAVFTVSSSEKGAPPVDFMLNHQSSLLMKAGAQNFLKHAVKSLDAGRVSLTFRLQKRTLAGHPIVTNWKTKGRLPKTVKQMGNKSQLKEKTKEPVVPPFQKKEKGIAGVDPSSSPGREEDLKKLDLELNNYINRERDHVGEVNGLIDLFLASSDDEPCEEFLKKVEERSQTKQNDCFLEALSKACNVNQDVLLLKLKTKGCEEILEAYRLDKGFSEYQCKLILEALELKIKILKDGKVEYWGSNKCKISTMFLKLEGCHFTCGDSQGFRPRRVAMLGAERSPDSGFFGQGVGKVSLKRDGDARDNLIESFLEGNTGISLNYFSDGDVFLDSLKNGKKRDGDAVDVNTLYGFAGCGKSRPVQQYLTQTLRKSFVVSPRRNLVNDWIEKTKGARHLTVKSFEVAFKMNLRGVENLFVDEIGLLPSGYLDLLIEKFLFENDGDLKNRQILLIGDPLQAEYYNRDDEGSLSKTAVRFPLAPQVPYSAYTFRCGQWIEDVFDVSSCRLDGSSFSVDCFEKINEDIPILVASHNVKDWMQERYPKAFVCTYGESQGLTFDDAQIVLSNGSKSSSDGQIVVALTRSRNKPTFFLSEVGELHHFIENCKRDSIWRYTLEGKRANLLHGLEKKGLMISLNPTLFGAKENFAEDRLVGDPYLKGSVFLGQVPDLESVSMEQVEVIEPATGTHLPKAVDNRAVIEVSQRMRAKESREIRSAGEESTQFNDLNVSPNKNSVSYSSPDNFESIYPRHKSSDDVTFLAAVRKRLRFSEPFRELSKFEKARERGRKLAQVFMKHIPLDGTVDQELLDLCQMEFESKRMEKSKKVIEAHAERSDPDWPVDFARIFMKSQICTKFDNRFVDAKAGQTLACFHHDILLHFGPWCRYAEKKLLQAMPSNFYLHSNKNFNQLNDWVKAKARGGLCVESDYTAFDSSQDANILAFEEKILEFLNWPRYLIEDYINLKVHLGSRLGNFAIMRFTGEFGTFLFNSMANMVFTFCKYKVGGEIPILFAGDDMCALGNLMERRRKDPMLELIDGLRLKAKVQRTENPTFCGWCLTPLGIFKQPALILERCLIAEELGKVRDVVDSYAIECSYAYALGDNWIMVMSLEQAEYHQLATRFLVRHKHLMQGVAYEVLTNSCA